MRLPGAEPFFIRVFTGLVLPRVTILGNEFAGQIEALGPAVTSFAPSRTSGRRRFAPGSASSSTARPGAIGSAAVQLLASRGVHVTAVCDTAHIELVRGLGAERVIDRTAEDFTQDEQTYDMVFDAVGKSSFGRCRRLLEPRGLYLSTDLGPRGQNPFLALVTPLLPGKSVLFGFPRHDQAMINDIKDLMASGLFRPVIDRRYPLAEIVEAYRYVETRQKVGSVVITVEQGD